MKLEEFAGGKRRGMVAIGVVTEIPLVAKHPNTRVAARVRLRNVNRTVRGPIVGDDQLEIASVCAGRFDRRSDGRAVSG
jgi:hypothetical protein